MHSMTSLLEDVHTLLPCHLLWHLICFVHQAETFDEWSQHWSCWLECWSHNQQILKCSACSCSNALHEVQLKELYLAHTALLHWADTWWNASLVCGSCMQVCTVSTFVKLVLDSCRFWLRRISVLDLGHITQSPIAELSWAAVPSLSSTRLGTTVIFTISTRTHVWLGCTCKSQPLVWACWSVCVTLISWLLFSLLWLLIILKSASKVAVGWWFRDPRFSTRGDVSWSMWAGSILNKALCVSCRSCTSSRLSHIRITPSCLLWLDLGRDRAQVLSNLSLQHFKLLSSIFQLI